MNYEADRRRTYIGVAAIAVVAFLIVAAPSGGDFMEVVSGALQAGFLAAIAVSAVRFYRERSMWISSLPDRHRALLIGAVATALFTIVADGRFREIGSGWVLPWLAVLAACGFTVLWVWRESRRYSF